MLENQLSRYGAIAQALPLTFGKVFFVANSANSWFGDFQKTFPNDRDGAPRVFSSLTDAYNACTSGRNDVIVVDGNSSITESTGINWTKNRINVFGISGGRLTDQSAKIVVSGSSDTSGYVIKVTGTRNSFHNIKFIQDCTNDAATTVAQFGGEGTYCENCSFIFSQTTELGETDANEVVMGEDSGTFVSCEFGADTLLTTGARQVMLLKQVTSGQECKSNRFRNCVYKISSSSSSALFIKVNSTADVLFTNIWENCLFVASVDSAGGAALTNAVASASGLVKGTLNFFMCASFSCTGFCDGVTDQVLLFSPIGNAAEAGEAGTPNS